MKEINIFELQTITFEVIEFYRNHLDLAERDYKLITTNNRGLIKPKREDEGYTYYEIHHIIPECMNGQTIPENLVMLTYNEHIKAHMLLYILYPEEQGLMISFKNMLNLGSLKDFNLKIDIQTLSELRERYADYLSKNNPMKDPEIVKKFSGENSPSKRPEVRQKLSELRKKNNPMFNQEVVEKMIQSKLGSKLSEETKLKLSKQRQGRKMSDESKETISQIRLSLGLHLSDSSKDFMKFSKSHDVLSPEGKRYISLSEAARDVGVSRTTIKSWIDNQFPYPGWKFVERTEETKKKVYELASSSKKGKIPKGENNLKAKKVISPTGKIFNTLTDAAKDANVSRSTMNRWLTGKIKKNPGWKFIEK